MIFSSLSFFAFFAIYFCFHLAIPLRFRNYLVIAGSTVFYSWWNIAYAWLPYLLMAIAFGGSKWMMAAKNDAGVFQIHEFPLPRERRRVLGCPR
jgi:alginate O-acetyltransferase complex protein AlgI